MKTIDPTARLTVCRSMSMDNRDFSIDELVELAKGKQNARISIETYYDETNIEFIWDELETDEEYRARISAREKRIARNNRKKAAEQARLAIEREADFTEFNRLKLKLGL